MKVKASSGSGSGGANSYIVFSPDGGYNYYLYIDGTFGNKWSYTSHTTQHTDSNITITQYNDTTYTVLYKKNCTVTVGTGTPETIPANTTRNYSYNQNIYVIF